MRKLARPIIKKVGMSFSGKACSNHIIVSAELAHRSIIIQNTLSAIFSIITYTTRTGKIGYFGEPERWGQPAQQQGLRIPFLILSRPTVIRRFLVSSFFADVTQQIHSFRASGVISAQSFFTRVSDSITFLKSVGSTCTKKHD